MSGSVICPLSFCLGFSSLCGDVKTQELLLKLVVAGLSNIEPTASEEGDVTAACDEETENEGDGVSQEGVLRTVPLSPSKKRRKSVQYRAQVFSFLGNSVEDLEMFVRFVVCAGRSYKIRGLGVEIAAVGCNLLLPTQKLNFLSWSVAEVSGNES